VDLSASEAESAQKQARCGTPVAGAKILVMRNEEFSAWEDFKFTLQAIIGLVLLIGGLGYLIFLVF
jgi:hypothetical protein